MKQLAELQQFISLDISYLIARQARSRVRANLARQAKRHNAGPCQSSMSGPKVPRGAEFLWLVFSNPVSELLTGEKSPPSFSGSPCQNTQLWKSALHDVTSCPNTSQAIYKTSCQSIGFRLQGFLLLIKVTNCVTTLMTFIIWHSLV